MYPIGAAVNVWKFLGDIRNFVFIADDNDNGDKLFTGVNNTGDKFSPLSFPPVLSLLSDFHRFQDNGD